MNQHSCRECNHTFWVSEQESRFREKLSLSIGRGVLLLPKSELCDDCRLRRRYAFRNDWNYYKRNCSRCDRQIISIYSVDKTFPVYCPECFWSDDWDPRDYGRDFDYSRSLFEQYAELQAVVPRIAIFNTLSENSEYTTHCTRNKSCYLVASVHESENVLYSDLCRSSRDCLDMFSSDFMELCYQCVFCLRCYGSEFLEHCVELTDSTKCFDCRTSTGLLGCVGLRTASYAVLNRQCSKEQFLALRQRYHEDLSFANELDEQFERLKHQHPHPARWSINTEDSTGNLLRNCKHVHDCFNVRFLEDCLQVFDSSMSQDCASSAQISKGQLLYECHAITETSSSAFCNLTYNCRDMLYCDNCQAGCHHCFASISLKRQEFCVLNKQFEESDYFATIGKIVERATRAGEWGYYFPVTVSPFAYNETKAMIWFPLSKEEASARNWKWMETENLSSQPEHVLSAAELAKPIADVTDDILHYAIRCEATGRMFRIVAYELEFYRRKNIRLPKRSPWRRHIDRVVPRLIRSSHTRPCAICNRIIDAYHSSDVSYPIVCEKCYNINLHDG